MDPLVLPPLLSVPPQSQSRKGSRKRSSICARRRRAPPPDAEARGHRSARGWHRPRINTPTQYVTDNVGSLPRVRTAQDLLGRRRASSKRRATARFSRQAVAAADTAFANARVDYILQEVPKALAQSMEGLHRVGHIVSAMDFSTLRRRETPVDLNRSIATTITVATNEWNYVTDVVTSFDPELPAVKCMRDGSIRWS